VKTFIFVGDFCKLIINALYPANVRKPARTLLFDGRPVLLAGAERAWRKRRTCVAGDEF
jgi:hypothetical protein